MIDKTIIFILRRKDTKFMDYNIDIFYRYIYLFSLFKHFYR